MKVSRSAICIPVFNFVPFMKLNLSSSVGITPRVNILSEWPLASCREARKQFYDFNTQGESLISLIGIGIMAPFSLLLN